jgi:hypothetical protein
VSLENKTLPAARALHRLWAWMFGYFWAPCPVCGKHFGGHECGRSTVPLMYEKGRGKLVCSHECGKKAQELNDARGIASL